MPTPAEALKNIERISRALRYRLTGDCIEGPTTRHLTVGELVDVLNTDLEVVTTSLARTATGAAV